KRSFRTGCGRATLAPFRGQSRAARAKSSGTSSPPAASNCRVPKELFVDLETVLYDVRDGVARITMNRPDKRNALNHQLIDDLAAAFAEAERDRGVRVVVLAANGASFCAGYDLKGSYYTKPPEEDGRWTAAGALGALR